MASYHLSLKSGKRGAAAEHSRYIGRDGKYRSVDGQSDLQVTGLGNFPSWANHPLHFWKTADQHERKNAAAYREIIVALPVELTTEQQRNLVDDFIDIILQNRPYQYAIHCPTASIGGTPQPHSHIMFCDRADDGLPRSVNNYFKRFNRKAPAQGGAKKLSGGKTPQEIREFMLELRRTWADLQNHYLQRHGHLHQVDHRSNADRGITADPEAHLGPHLAREMTLDERRRLLARRSQHAFLR